MPQEKLKTMLNSYANFWGDKQRALSMVCYDIFWSGQ